MCSMPSETLSRELAGLAHGLGLPASHRDASGSASNAGPWKKPPTAIQAPTNNRRQTGRSSNPYVSTRLQDTLSIKRNTAGRSGNNTSKQTVLQSKHFQAARKQPSRMSGPVDAFGPIHVSDNSEEDVGQLVMPSVTTSNGGAESEGRSASPGPDPIDIVSDEDETRPSTSKRVTTTPSRRTYQSAEDGKSTARLRRQLGIKKPKFSKPTVIDMTGDDHDPIETDTDEDQQVNHSRNPARPSGQAVAKLRAFHEQKAAGESTPHVDLLAALKQSVRKQMKPNLKTVSVERSQEKRLDPFATSPSDFTKGPTPKPAARAVKPRRTIELRLDAWARGLDVFDCTEDDDKPLFCFDGADIQIKDAKGIKFEYKVLYSISKIASMREPISHVKCPLIQLRTSGCLRPYPHYDVLHAFKHGSEGADGKLTFKFSTDDANWVVGYRNVVNLLLEIVPGGRNIIDNHASTRIWACTVEASKFPRDRESDSGGDIIAQQLPEADRLKSPVRPQPRARPSHTRDTMGASAVSARTLRSNTKPTVENARPSPAPDADEIILVYPPSETGAVNITRADLSRLDPGQYLNDTLIEFGLKLWLNDVRERDPAFADQIHIFSSFFYKKIQVKDKEEGYASVRKWTSKFDLFKKKYLIVPINEHVHWYLAIICNPEYMLQPPPPQPEKVVSPVQTRKRKRDSDLAQHEEARASSPGISAPFSPAGSAQEEGVVEAMLGDCTISNQDTSTEIEAILSPKARHPSADEEETLLYPDLDSMEVDASNTDVSMNGPSEQERPSPTSDEQMDVEPATSSAEGMGRQRIPPSRFYRSASSKGKERAVLISPEIPFHDSEEDITTTDVPPLEHDEGDETAVSEPIDLRREQTHIFTFDSLGMRHPAAARHLGIYLQYEARDKKRLDLSQTTLISGQTALVPAQPNYCDCGVYLIHFVQTFMRDPVKMTEKILQTKNAKTYDSQEREADWDAEIVAGLRDTLKAKVWSLSDQWKTAKAAKKIREAATGSNTPSVADGEVIPDSDDEIVVSEVISKSTLKRSAQGKRAARNDKPKAAEGEALRLR